MFENIRKLLNGELTQTMVLIVEIMAKHPLGITATELAEALGKKTSRFMVPLWFKLLKRRRYIEEPCYRLAARGISYMDSDSH